MSERPGIPRASRPFESPMTLAVRNRCVTVAPDTSLRPAGADIPEADPAQAVAADPSVIDAERHPLYGHGVKRHQPVLPLGTCCGHDFFTWDGWHRHREVHRLSRLSRWQEQR